MYIQAVEKIFKTEDTLPDLMYGKNLSSQNQRQISILAQSNKNGKFLAATTFSLVVTLNTECNWDKVKK